MEEIAVKDRFPKIFRGWTRVGPRELGFFIESCQDRLTAEQIRVHPFFQGLDFKKLRQMSPPIKPVVGSTDGAGEGRFIGCEILHHQELGWLKAQEKVGMLLESL